MQSDNQSLVYLLILLGFLLMSLFFRREMKFTKALKYLAAWGFIAIIMVALYAYRFEFSDFKNRILGEINPQKPIGQNGKIIINIAQDKHFYLNAKINGKTIRFMIDTGASDIVLNLNDAKEIGINVERLSFNKPYQTANGVIFGASTVVEEIEIAGVKFYGVKASVNKANLGVSLLGMSFLREFKRYEFYQDKLILEF